MTDKALMLVPRSIQEVETLAAKFAKSNLLPDALRGREADVFVSIMAGQELGLPPMAALRGVHVVQGKPILSADTMVAIVLGSGLCEYFICVEDSTTSATYETKRHNTPKPQRCTWTVEDAQRAGLIKDGGNWIKHPRAMVKARAKAMLARDVYPDVLAGCYDEDEADEIRANAPQPPPPTEPNAIDAEVIEKPAEDLAELAAKADTMADLQALAPRISALPKGSTERTNAAKAYNERKAFLSATPTETPAPAAQETAA